MKRIARAAVVTGIAMGSVVLAAPAALADVHIYVAEGPVGQNGPTILKDPTFNSEQGPGDLMVSDINKSPKAEANVGNKPVKTGDISTTLKGGKGNTAVTEVEGPEQDAVEGAAEQGAAEQEGAEQKGAEQEASGERKGDKQHGDKKDADKGDKKDKHHGDKKDGDKKDGHKKDGLTVISEQGPGDLVGSQISKSPKAEANVGNKPVKTGDISTKLYGGEGNSVVNEVEGTEQDEVAASAERKDGKDGKDGKGHSAKLDDATIISEQGPGDLVGSEISKSPKAEANVGNKPVKTGDISTVLKGGKGNSVVNEVEGTEQDAGEQEGAEQEGAEQEAGE